MPKKKRKEKPSSFQLKAEYKLILDNLETKK